MEHLMNLNNEPFDAIKSGTKTVEMRLFDEKRQKIKVGDVIVFANTSTGETLKAEVVETAVYKNFEELYLCYNKLALGYNEADVAKPEDMLLYYPQEKIEKYGAFAIVIKVL